MRSWHNTDLASLQHAQESTTTLHTASLSPSLPPQDGNNETHKRKCKREKEQRLSSSSIPLTIANDTHVAQAHTALPTPVLDDTLLAVIGILHAV
jgi:hypothetical protein